MEESGRRRDAAGAQGLAEDVPVEVVGIVEAVEVGLLARMVEMVDDQDVGLASGVEFAHDVRADEAGASGDDEFAHAFQ